MFDPAVPSRDGNRIAIVRHLGKVGYLEIGPAGGGPRRVIFHSRGCCENVAWASRYLIAFVNDGIQTIDVRTLRVRLIAEAFEFNISSDGRWIAWSRTAGPETPDTVGVVSITGDTCLLVARPRNRQDSLPFFHPGGTRLYFLREPFEPEGGSGPVGSGRTGTIGVPMSSLRRAPASACLW